MKKLALLGVLGLAACAQPQQQAAQLPASPTGCYVMHHGLLTAAIFGRYEPAPCGVINPAEPRYSYAPPPLDTSIPYAPPLPQISVGSGAWSGAGPGWAGGGAAAFH